MWFASWWTPPGDAMKALDNEGLSYRRLSSHAASAVRSNTPASVGGIGDANSACLAQPSELVWKFSAGLLGSFPQEEYLILVSASPWPSATLAHKH